MTTSVTPPATTTSWLDDASARFVAILPEHIERLRWDSRTLRAHHDHALADLVRTAVRWSPFHRRRLADIEPDGIGTERLSELPVMTKAAMMAELDDVFTDRRLTRGLVERHLATLEEEPRLLLDEYVVLATGGSSGTRGVFVIPRDGVASYSADVVRAGMAQLSAATGWPPPTRLPIGLVVAPGALHATRSMSVVLSSIADLTYAPVTLPLSEIVDRLNRAQPLLLVGYPSVPARLGDAAVAGDLRIQPRMVLSTSEQLLPHHVERITAGLGVPPGNSFGSTEGLLGTAPPGSDELTFASDRAIIELVDADDRPVPAGTPAHHILITNLTSHAQPLIRYRMDDVMTEMPPAPEHGHQRATVGGRDDGPVPIGDTTVHPLAIRAALLRHQTITEYQVRVHSTDPPRIDLALVTSGPTSLHQVEQDVAAALRSAGAPATVAVSATAVGELERHPVTGKVQRFVITTAAPAPGAGR